MLDYIALGKRIKNYRMKINMTQAQVAEKLNVSSNYISQIERGIAKISLNRLQEIAECINTPMQYLVADISVNNQQYLMPEITDKLSALSPTNKQFILEVTELIKKYSEEN